jgi:hypothetical protein
MRLGRIVAVLAVAGLLAGCQDQPVAPSEDSPEVLLGSDHAMEVWWANIDLWWVDICGYGPVHWTGRAHFVERFFPDNGGNAHALTWANWQLKGEALFQPGWWWRLHEKYGDQSNWEFPYAGGQDMWYIVNQTLNLVGYGGAPNLKLKVRLHYTVNANGVEVNFIDQYDPLCE